MKTKIVTLIMLVAVFLLASCGAAKNGHIRLEVESIEKVSAYTIVRSADASKAVKDAVSSLSTAFYKVLGESVKVAEDTADEKNKEIIIGNTKREVKGFDIGSLGFNEYIVKKFGDKIVIAGGSDKATVAAVEFVREYLIVENVLKAPIGKDGYTAKVKGIYENLKIDGAPLSEYTIVTNLFSGESAKVLSAVLDEIGCPIPTVTIDEFDLTAGKYILFDDTNTDFSNYSVKIENGNVTFYANYVTIFDCVDYFVDELLGYDVENDRIKGNGNINILSSMSREFKVENSPVYTKEKLMEVLGEVYADENSVIIAQHTYGSNGTQVETERSRYKENCGVDVPMIGYDIVDTRTATKNERVKEAYDFIQFMREGGIVTFSIHLVNPIDPEAGYRGTPFTAQNWQDLLTEGTEINTFLMDQLSMIADFLEIFHKNDAPIIFRPLHEMNGNWFWFCITNPDTGETISKETAQNFWKLIYNYMTDTRGITNMLWEYSPNVASNADNVMHYYPGDDYCDLVSCDWYTSQYKGHQQLTVTEGALRETGKIFSMAEFGPSGELVTDFSVSEEYKFDCGDLDAIISEVFDDGIKAAYWMLWSSYADVKISMWNMGEVEFFYENDRYLTLEDTFALLYN